MYDITDKSEIINNVKYPKLKELLNQIDWNYLTNGFPVIFHGDLHFENIIKLKKNLNLLIGETHLLKIIILVIYTMILQKFYVD